MNGSTTGGGGTEMKNGASTTGSSCHRRFGRKEGRRHRAGWDDEKVKDIPELKQNSSAKRGAFFVSN
jgi:hypothetical protein